MARMLDRLLQRGVEGDVDFRAWAQASGLTTCERIVVDNVSDYFYAHAGKTVWDWVADFPNLAPPFDTFWMEANAPRTVRDAHGKPISTPPEAQHRATGVMAAGVRKPDEMSPGEFVLMLADAWGFMRAGVVIANDLLDAPVRWALAFSIFLEDRLSQFQFVGNRILWLDGEGRLLDIPGRTSEQRIQGIWTVLGPPFLTHAWRERHGAEAAWEAQRFISSMLSPYGLALSLMHCKNVEIRPAPTPERVRDRRHRHRRPALTYRVLEIEPMKRVLRSEGRIAETGMRLALHICRGHFKDYRQRGLFGKLRGIYWWDSHLRGDLRSGVAVKDYEIAPLAAATGGIP